MIKETTDFVDTETGEVLCTMNIFLNTLECAYDKKLARETAYYLNELIKRYFDPIAVISTRTNERNKTLQMITIFTRGEEEEDEEEEED